MKRQTAPKEALFRKLIEYLGSQSPGKGRNMIDKLKQLILEKQKPAAAKPAFKPRPKGTLNLQHKSLIFSSRL